VAVRFQATVLFLLSLITFFSQPPIAASGLPRAETTTLTAQAQPPLMQQAPQFPPFPTPGRPSPEDEARQRMEKEMAKKANLQRQEQLKRDTDKLLQLAKELKQSVDKSNADVLSVDVVRKAEEIEKLAHSVKEKMKND
jgi:hypothetical protein